MSVRNTTSEWGSLAKALHWLIAIGIFVLIYLGLEQAGIGRILPDDAATHLALDE